MACVDGQCIGQIVDGGSFTGGTTGHHGPGGGVTSGGTNGSGTSGQTGGGSGGTQGSGSNTGQSNASSTGGAANTGSSAPGPYVTGSGCGCGAGSGGGSALPLAIFGIALLRHRRRARLPGPKAVRDNGRSDRRAHLLTASAVVLLGSWPLACSGGGGSTTTGGTAGTNATIGGTLGGSATNGSSGGTNGSNATTGSGTSGCAYETCAGACVDLSSDSQHCGACDKPCLSGEICVEGACGQGNQNPHLTSLSPNVAALNSALTVTINGERLQSGAQVFLTGAGLPANDLQPTTFVSSSVLTADLNFDGVPSGVLTVSVVNPGSLISNDLTFTLAAPGVPVLTSVSPMQAPTGSTATLTFVGQALTGSTEIHVEGGTVPNTAIPTNCTSSTACTASWDLSAVAPGNYSLSAVNPGASSPSNSLTFTVSSISPSVTSATPPSANSNSQPSVELVGTGFDSSSRIQFGPSGGTLATVPTTYISSTQIFATLNLTNLMPGPYELSVTNNGGLQSGLIGFAVTSATPSLLSLSPSQGGSGTTVPLTAGGVGFDPSSTLHFQNSMGGADVPLTTSYNGATSLATSLSLSGVTPGSFQLVVVNSGGLTSSPFPFTVTTNIPTVTKVNPASLSQSAGKQDVSLTGSNFTPGMTVQLSPLPSGAAIAFNATIVDGQDATINVDPSSLSVASYLLSVTNPGNFVSNSADFSITPGTPTLTSMTPSDSPQQQVTVVLCGQYFLATSTVHVSGLNGSFSPSATFGNSCANNAPSLSVSIDLTSASPGDYSVSVWNSSTLQSAALTFTVDGA
jgi:uncharacterized protein (TIGR03382 family)